MAMVSKYFALNIDVKLLFLKTVVLALSVNNFELLDGAFHLTLEKNWFVD